MNYSGIKRISTVVTQNNCLCDKAIEEETDKIELKEASESIKLSKNILKSKLQAVKDIKSKLDVFDLFIIPLGLGILASFIILITKVI